jgi:hypothetical protein
VPARRLLFNLLDGLAYDPEPLGAEARQHRKRKRSFRRWTACAGQFSNCTDIDFDILKRERYIYEKV